MPKRITSVITFNSNRTVIFFPEGSDSSYPLLTVNATDADAGNNAKIRYSILTPVEGISIDQTKGTLYANKTALSERTTDIELAIIASDMGKPPLSSVAAVRIHINNDRGMLPHFTQEEYQ